MTENQTINKTAEKLTPLVHMNGDSFNTLKENWSLFHENVNEALSTLPEVHGRNYYPKGDQATTEAIEAIQEIARKLDEIAKITLNVRLAIHEQG